MRLPSIKSPAPKEESPISSSPRDVPVAQLWWTQPIHSWRWEDGLKPLDNALMTQQYLARRSNSNFCRRWKTSVLKVEGPNKYPNVFEIFALQAGPSWFLIRSLRLIIRYKYQLVFILTVVIPRMRLRNGFLSLTLPSVNVLKAVTYFKEPSGWSD